MPLDDISRAIGRLESTVKTIHTDVCFIKKDVISLKNFKWKITYISVGVMATCTALSNYILVKLRGY